MTTFSKQSEFESPQMTALRGEMMTDTPMKKRLAVALCKTTLSDWHHCKDAAYAGVDAILREMLEPNEGMVRACMAEGKRQKVALDEMSPPLYFGPVITAAIQYIFNES